MKKRYAIIIVIIILAGVLIFTPTEQNDCEKNGGIWVESMIGGFLDLNVSTDAQCFSWGGSCGPERVISSFTIGTCSDNNDCWLVDIWEPTCLVQG